MKKIWLDLELREDIDDLITLIVALENKNLKIEIVSIHNPSLNELYLLNYILTKYNHQSKNTILINGKITFYESNKDINISLMKYLKKSNINYNTVDNFIENIDKEYLNKLIYLSAKEYSYF